MLAILTLWAIVIESLFEELGIVGGVRRSAGTMVRFPPLDAFLLTGSERIN